MSANKFISNIKKQFKSSSEKTNEPVPTTDNEYHVLKVPTNIPGRTTNFTVSSPNSFQSTSSVPSRIVFELYTPKSHFSSIPSSENAEDD